MSSTAKSETKKSRAKKPAENVAKPPEEQTICIIRIRGAHGMNRKILNNLQLLNLHSVNHCTLVRSSPSVRGMLQKGKDYIAYGPLSVDSVKALLKKRGYITGNKPLTDDYIRQTTVYKSIDDLAKAIFDGKIKLKEVQGLKPVFRLHPPKGGHSGSIKKAVGSGGVLGNVGEKIDLYLKKMI